MLRLGAWRGGARAGGVRRRREGCGVAGVRGCGGAGVCLPEVEVALLVRVRVRVGDDVELS